MSTAPQIPPLGIDTVTIARYLGLELQRTSHGYSCRCPLHVDNNPSLALYHNGEDKGWYCFGCGVGGDGPRLLIAVMNHRFEQAGNPARLSYTETISALYGSQSSLQVALQVRARTGQWGTGDELTRLYVMANAGLRAMRGHVAPQEWNHLARQVDEALHEGSLPGMAAALAATRERVTG